MGKHQLAEHWSRDAIRTECEETEFGRDGYRWLIHSCPRCAHGRIKGFEMRVGGDEGIDRRQRLLKQATIDGLPCEADHPDLPVIGGGKD